MSKKYELVKNDYIKHEGKILYRIRALRDFSNVKAGDVGGYVQSEDNLSHKGDCWVYYNAKVFNNAKIHDNARIYGNAQIYGDAEVFGSARIYGNAEVYDNAYVYGNARIHGNAKIYDEAGIFDNATVFENTRVCNNARIKYNARVYGNAKIERDTIIGQISTPYKKVFQYQCEKRVLTAILTEDNKILYSIGCQENLTKEEFIYRIHNTSGGLEENPHRYEYLKLIKTINFHFKEKLNN